VFLHAPLGMATTSWQLALAGGSSASARPAGSPPSYSLISDYFRRMSAAGMAIIRSACDRLHGGRRPGRSR